ncbi:hypothetical protein MLG50_23750, partial [Escherichia coli]|nr:hypothetical protein [Escherichia coli]
MAKVRFENSLNKMIFEIRGYESFSEMETALLDFCDETMGANHPDTAKITYGVPSGAGFRAAHRARQAVSPLRASIPNAINCAHPDLAGFLR